jgi:MFS family permease
VANLALASMMYSPVAKALMIHQGISSTFWIIGGILLILLTGFSQLLANPPENLDLTQKPAAENASSVNRKPSEMVKTGNFYKIWSMFALSAASSLMIVGHAANIAREQANWNGGFILVILLAVFNGGGRFLGGFLSDKLGQANLMRLTFIVQALNIFLFTTYTIPLSLIAGVAIAGLCYGSTMVVFSAATAAQYGVRNFGANYGIVFTAWGIAGLVGPLPSAVIFDATGCYHTAFIISGILVVISLVIALSYRSMNNMEPDLA